MLFRTLAVSLLLATLPAWSAVAWPASTPQTASDPVLIHHKPWHQGGPPWLRRNTPGKHYGWQRRRLESQRWQYQQPAPNWADMPRARDTFRFGD